MGNKFDSKGTVRSHYVCRFYLEPFTQDNGKLICKDIRNGKIFQCAPQNIAFENDMYRTQIEITKQDVEVFLKKGFHNNVSDKNEAKLVEGLVSYINNDYSAMSDLWQLISALKNDLRTDRFERNQEELFALYEEKFQGPYNLLLNRDNNWYNDVALDNQSVFEGYTIARTQMVLKHIFINAFELMEHVIGKKTTNRKFEKEMIEKIKEVKRMIGEQFLQTATDEEYLPFTKYFPLFYFINFISSQYFRTRKNYNRMLLNASEIQKRIDTINPVSLPILFIHYQSPAMGYKFIQKNYKIIFLINNSDVPFVTSDQPVVNAVPEDLIQPSEGIEFYYPLSPNLAILYTNLRWCENREIGCDEAKDWNRLIVSKAERFVFSKVDCSMTTFN